MPIYQIPRILLRLSFILFAFLIIVPNQSCKTFAGANPLNTVWSGVSHDRHFTILADLLKQTGWAEKLNGKEKYTLFAPTNEAFEKLGNDKLQELKKPENSAALLSIIESHIYAGELDKESLVTAGVLPPSVNGKTYPVQRKNNRFFIGNARPTRNPEYAGNGLFYVIEDVLQ